MTDVAQILGMGGGGDKRGRASLSSTKSSPGEPTPPQPPSTTYQQPSRALQKLQGKSREVMGLLKDSKSDPNSTPLPPSVPAFLPLKEKLVGNPNEEGTVKVGNRWIKIQSPARKWAWAPFSSSSRTDGTLFHHWVRSNVEYPDYPYARFDIHLDPIVYSDEEYQRYLVSDTWTKSETDRLMELARRHEMRWPVIFDRWIEMFYLDQPQTDDGNDPPKVERKIEDLQFRFYQVAAVLNQVAIKLEASTEAQMLAAATPDAAAAAAAGEDAKGTTEQSLFETAAARQLAGIEGSQQPLIACPGSGTSNKVFDLEYERQRRIYLEALWNRTKDEETEERELRKELKQIEAQLRKMKKSGAHILAARKIGVAGGSVGAASGGSGNTGSSRNTSRSVSPVPEAFVATGITPATATSAGTGFPALLDEAFSSTAPVAMPGTPYLQSGRLVPPAAGGSTGLSKSILNRLETFLHELKIPDRPLPTKRVCDLYDSVRKDIVSLLLVLKNVLQKEGLVHNKRLRLERLTGNVRMSEESVMGITYPPATPAPISVGPSGNTATGSSSGPRQKAKASSKTGGKVLHTSGAAMPGSDITSSGTKSKATGATKPKTGTEPKAEGNRKEGSALPTQAPSASAPVAAAASGNTKQGVNKNVGAAGGGEKQAVGGKQPKKSTTKRKRKAESNTSSTAKSPAPGPPSTTNDTSGSAITDKKAESTTSTATAGQPPPEQQSEPKSSTKKRPRKTAPAGSTS